MANVFVGFLKEVTLGEFWDHFWLRCYDVNGLIFTVIAVVLVVGIALDINIVIFLIRHCKYSILVIVIMMTVLIIIMLASRRAVVAVVEIAVLAITATPPPPLTLFPLPAVVVADGC